MDIQPLKDAYWTIVTDCLERFHGYAPVAARTAALELRQAIEFPLPHEAPPGYDSELFYHAEPFYVACNMADRELDPDAYGPEYNAIVRRHYRAAEDQLQRQGGLLRPAYAGV